MVIIFMGVGMGIIFMGMGMRVMVMGMEKGSTMRIFWLRLI